MWRRDISLERTPGDTNYASTLCVSSGRVNICANFAYISVTWARCVASSSKVHFHHEVIKLGSEEYLGSHGSLHRHINGELIYVMHLALMNNFYQ